ncbi:MAG: sulfatase [Candidatus Aminicenantes bacterium]|nr:MAG: sulfatase [Candidatus Aminicenantes bacterium]
MIFLVLPNCKKEVKPNILLITIDTLRRDRVGCYGYTLDTTPFIDELAKEGLVFKNVITPLPFTDPSHASILTSLHPLTHQLVANARKLNTNVETMAEVLKKNGYYTIGTVAAKHMSGKYNFSQGFDSFSDEWDPGVKDWKKEVKHFSGNWQRVAKSVNESLSKQVEDYLDKHSEKPLFIWVHYYDPHYPYIDREDIVLKQKKKQWIQYDKEIRYTDNYIAKLYRFLEEKGLMKKTITCITSDHGEQLGEHGYGADHVDFYSETIFVPLIFYGFKIPKNKIVEEYVSTMDIGVTLLELVNLNFERSVDGVPLLDSKGNLAALPHRDFLIMGYPLKARSVQLISFPYSYILNSDFFYKYWFVSLENQLPENRFKPIRDKWVHLRHFDKTNYYEIRITLPYTHTFRKGLNYVVLRFEIEKNNEISVGYYLNENKWSKPFHIDKTKGTVTAYFPAAPLDMLLLYVGFNEGAKIANLRYTFVSKEEFSTISASMKKIESKRIFNAIKSIRKFKTIDELYNLDSDIEMLKNLLKGTRYSKKVLIEGKIKIYRFLSNYLEKMKQIIGKRKPEKPLTEKEKEMLKSLGYL